MKKIDIVDCKKNANTKHPTCSLLLVKEQTTNKVVTKVYKNMIRPLS